MPRELPVSNPDLPDFAVKVDGTALERIERDDVLRIDVHEEVGKLARAQLLLRNWRDEENTVRHSDADTFAPGKKVEIQVGYGGSLETVFEGVVTELQADFVSNRQPTLLVSCRCKGALLAGGCRTRLIEDGTDGDLAGAMAGDYGLTPATDDGAKHLFLLQAARPDWDFLAERARTLGFAFYVRGDALVFRLPDYGAEPTVSLEWAATLLELEIHEDLNGRVKTATVASWNPESLEAADATVGASDARPAPGARPALDAALDDTSWPDRESRLVHAGAVADDELAAEAHAAVDHEALRECFGRGRAIGLPMLRMDSTVELLGVGTRFSGRHYLSAVRHTLDRRGFQTDFQIGLPPALRPDPHAGRAAQAPLATGVVEDLDDPNGWGRVRVALPWLSADQPSLWARLALPAAGDARGFFFVPEVGDEVVVGFLGGDVRFPVVLGSVWNGQQAPPKTIDAEKNDVRSIVSRAGHEVTFDDGDSAPQVLVSTAAGQTVTLDDTSGSEKIELVDKGGSKVTLDSKGITLEASADLILKAPSGKIALDCSKLEAKSTGAAKLESSAALDLKASATLGIKGSLVKIN
jgi:phage protein D/phage baseplate assembly protein gpV